MLQLTGWRSKSPRFEHDYTATSYVMLEPIWTKLDGKLDYFSKDFIRFFFKKDLFKKVKTNQS